MNDTDYIERKREEARRHYAASIERLDEGMACCPCVAGPRITLRDGRYYVDPLRRTWRNDEVPEGLVPVAQETAVALSVAYDLDAYGVVGAVEPSESNRTLALALVEAAKAAAAGSPGGPDDDESDIRLYEAEGPIIDRLGIGPDQTELGLTVEAVRRIEAFVSEALGRSWSYEDAGLLGTSGASSSVKTYEIQHVYTGEVLSTVEAETPLAALDAYAVEEGFSPYSELPDADGGEWTFTLEDGRLAGVFTNYAIAAKEIA